jgi:hypothetical protein
MSEYISKSTIIKYRDNGLTEKSIQMYLDKRSKYVALWPLV